MLDEKNRKTAKLFGILDTIQDLQTDLLALEDVEDVDFDLDSYWSNIPYVIFLPKYHFPAGPYTERKQRLLRSILDVAESHGMTRTDDTVEDYGQRWYIVTRLASKRMKYQVLCRADHPGYPWQQYSGPTYTREEAEAIQAYGMATWAGGNMEGYPVKFKIVEV